MGPTGLGSPTVFETFTEDPIAKGTFVQQTAGTETTFTYNFFRGDLRAVLDVDSQTAYYLSQPFAAITEKADASFSTHLRVESYDGRSSPTAFIGLTTTRHVENFGDGLTFILATREGRLTLNASIDQGGFKAEGLPIPIALGADYWPHVRYSASTRQLELTLHADKDLQSVVGQSIAILPEGRTFQVDRIGIQNGGARVTDQTVGSITVVVDDLFLPAHGPVPISITGGNVVEGNAGTTDAVFEVRLDFPAEQEVAVSFSTEDGSALVGQDYRPASGLLTFPPGVTLQRIRVPVIGDSAVEADETFSVRLNNSVNATLKTAHATASILDDDLPMLRIADPTLLEGNEGTQEARFEITLSTPSTRAVTIDYVTADGTATAAADYVARQGTLTFPAGITQQTVSVPVRGDAMLETDETFFLDLSNPVNVSLSTNRVLATVLNDDRIPTLSIADASTREGDAGSTPLEIIVTLSNPSSQSISVDYATADGTATGAVDYQPITGTLTFPPGVLRQSITVPIIADTVDEPDETFRVILSRPIHAELSRSEATATVVDDDPTPEILADSKSMPEGDAGDGSLVFTVRLSNPSSRTVTVSYSTLDGTATAGIDYASTAGALTFPPGTTSQAVPVTIHGDTLNELNETFRLAFTNAVNALLSTNTVQGTILNDDGATLTFEDVTVIEGNAGTVNAFLSVRLSRPSLQTVTVNYATSDGSATASSDYQPKSGTVTFPPGITSQSALIAINGDRTDEPNEDLFVTLTNPVNATLARSRGTITIVDDDAPEISIADTSAKEGDVGDSTATFVLSLSSPSDKSISVDYVTVNGTAIAGQDYLASSGSVVFPPGSTNQTLAIPILSDRTNEADETFQVSLSNPTQATLRRSQGQALLLDDDPFPTVTIEDAQGIEGDSGTVDMVFQVRLSSASGQPVAVDFSTEDGSALAGEDYIARSGTLTFPPGTTAQAIVIPINGDTADEPDETFRVSLRASKNATIARDRATGTIRDDDLTEISARNVSVLEGDNTLGQAVFQVLLSSPSEQEVRVDFRTVDGTARAGLDYIGSTGTLTFPAGVTTNAIVIPIIGDTIDELDETFSVSLSNPIHAKLKSPSLLGTILDDDQPPEITIQDVTVVEGDAGTTHTFFTASLSAPSGKVISVGYETVDGTAIAGMDYVARSGTIAFPPGETQQSIGIDVLTDTIDEPDETLTLRLSDPQNATLSRAAGIGMILDDDSPRISVVGTSLLEGDSGVSHALFQVRLSSSSSNAVAVSYRSEDGTATAGTDYSAVAGRILFPPGVTNQTLDVAVIGDRLHEPDETFDIVLHSPEGATLGAGRASAQILNDDALPTVSVRDQQIQEGDDGTRVVVVPLELSNVSGQTITVRYRTVDGTAVAGSDYVEASGVATFPPGTTRQTIDLTVLGDRLGEGKESFFLEISDPVHATIDRVQGVITILEDDPAQVSIVGTSVIEGDIGTTDALVEVRLSFPSANEVGVGFQTEDGSAVAGIDYVGTAGRLNFAPGETRKTLRIPVIGDTLIEGDETFQVTLSQPANATLQSDPAVVTILNDDLPSISISGFSVLEGNDGIQAVQVQAFLSAPSPRAVSCAYTTSDGTAQAPEDYVASQGTITFTPGTTRQTFVVSVVGDRIREADEVFQILLSNPSQGVLSTRQVEARILNDDALPEVSVDDASILEGDSSPVLLNLQVHLSNPSSEPVTVNYATANGTAVAGLDYVGQSGTVLFPPGSTLQVIPMTVLGDVLDEPDEGFVVTLSNPSHATLLRSTATVTILDNDPTPRIIAENKSLVEGDAGTSTMLFPVRLSGPSSRTVTVAFSTLGGTATEGVDYIGTSGRLTFLPGIVSQVVPVPLVGDLVQEANETLRLVFRDPVNGLLATNEVQGTILNDDGATLSIDDVTVVEGDGGTVRALFSVGLSMASSQTVTVDYFTADGSATAGSDYSARSGTLTFPPGSKAQTVSVDIRGDLSDEPDEVFSVNLANPLNATISKGQGLATILDDDVPEISIDDISLNAANGPVVGTFTISLSSSSTLPITVGFATTNATATGGSDYEPRSGTVTFPPGTVRAEIQVPVKGNTLDEGMEIFHLNLSNPQNATLRDPQGVCTILNQLRIPLPPEVAIRKPEDGSRFYSSSLIQCLVEATDPDGLVRSVELFAGTGRSVVLGAAPWGTVVSNLPAGTYTLVAVATDDDGLTATSAPVRFTVLADPINEAPLGIATPQGPDLVLECPSTPTFTAPVFTGGCSSPLVSNVETRTNTLGCTQVISRTWTVSDACGNTTNRTQTITVRDTTPPAVTTPQGPDGVMECPATPVFSAPVFTDACGGLLLPTITTVTNQLDCGWVVVRTWRAVDACGNATNRTQRITLTDTRPPEVTQPQGPDAVLECPAAPVFVAPIFTDACEGRVIPIVVTVTNTLHCRRTITRTWVATDWCGNVTNRSQKFTFEDHTPPVLAGVPADAVVTCRTIPEPATVTAWDACAGDLPVDFRETVTDAAATSYRITRTWTAADACGNAATASQHIRVTDVVAPSLEPPPTAQAEVLAGSPGATRVHLGVPVALNACGKLRMTHDAPAVFPVGTNTVVWTAIDPAGNTATCTQRVVVVRVTALPVITLADTRTSTAVATNYPVTLTATLDRASPQPVSVDYVTEDGTALAGMDYVAVPDPAVSSGPAERLGVEVGADGLRLTWRPGTGTSVLQFQEGLQEGSRWEAVEQPGEVVAGLKRVTMPVGVSPRFFRLARVRRSTLVIEPGETRAVVTIKGLPRPAGTAPRSFFVQFSDPFNATVGRGRAEAVLLGNPP